MKGTTEIAGTLATAETTEETVMIEGTEIEVETVTTEATGTEAGIEMTNTETAGTGNTVGEGQAGLYTTNNNQ